MFNYNHLYYFYVTAKLGGVTNASKYLRISQPSLSAQLKIFERSIDKKLFRKEGRNLALTDEGSIAYAHAKRIFSAADDFSEALKSDTEIRSNTLRIGVSDQVERPFIADILSPLIIDGKAERKSYFITTESTDKLIQDLRNKEIDLVVTNIPVYSEDLRELVAAKLPVNLMVSTQALKTAKLKISSHTAAAPFLAAAPLGLVLPSYKMKLRHETDGFIQQNHIRKNVVIETDILSVVGRAIMDGGAVGFLPTPYMLEEIKMGLISLIGPKSGYWKHSLHVFIRPDSIHDKTLDAVKTAIKRMEKISY
jgi:LysR family transcriptional activator of nhaA